MNTKNRLIKSLLKAAKKHKVLTYPVLAIVAVISVVDYFFSWSTGAGKRVVAIVMVMVMLVSQSYFLTSSATELIDDEEAALAQMELQEEIIADDDEDVPQEEPARQEEAEPVTESASEPEASTETDTTASVDSANLYMQEEVIEPDAAESVTVGGDDVDADTIAYDADTDEDADVEEDVLDEELDSKLDSEKQAATIYLFWVDEKGNYQNVISPTTIYSTDDYSAGKAAQSYQFDLTQATGDGDSVLEKAKAALSSSQLTLDGCYEYSSNDWYYDAACSSKAANTSVHATGSTSSGKLTIMLYCSRTLVQYKVSIVDADDGAASTYKVNGEQKEAGVPVYVKRENGEGSLTLTDLRKNGYTFSYATLNGTKTISSADGKTINVTLNDESPSTTLDLHWTRGTYQIRYNLYERGGLAQYVPQTVTYDGEDLVSDAYPNARGEKEGIQLKIDDKPGYVFDHWEFESENGSGTVNAGDYVSSMQTAYVFSEQESDPVLTLYPVLAADTIHIMRMDGKTTMDDGGVIDDFQFDLPHADVILRAYYGSAGEPRNSDQLSYSIKTSESTLAAWESDYGIKVSVNEGNSIHIGTAGPTAVPSEPLKLTFEIADDAREAAEEFTVYISVRKTEVMITAPADRTNEKVYDGTLAVRSDFNKTFATNLSGVTVTFDECEYESADVGTPKIILKEPHLNSEKDISGYKLVPNDGSGYSIPGVISKRKVYLATGSEITVVETGVATPYDAFYATEDTSVSLGEGEGFVNGESVDDLGVIEFSTFPERTDLLKTGYYRIQAKSGESNYQVIVNSASEGVFEVLQSDPKKDSNYRITGTYNEASGWYISGPAQISPIQSSGYNTVRVSKDQSDIMEGTEASPVNIHDDKEGTYYVQLYNSATGAQTSWQRINIKVDEKIPQYENFTVAVDGEELTDGEALAGGGLYFPGKGRALTFGSYFNKTLTVTIQYSDEVSGLSTLHYSIFNGAEQQIYFAKGVDGLASARFEIPAGVEKEIGEILFYADDVAGNVEASPNKLSRDGVTEWGVENTAPSVEPLVVQAGEYHAVLVESGSDTYYANCRAVLGVSDLASGIYDVTWNVNGETVSEQVSNQSGRQSEYTFTKDINSGTFPGAVSTDGKYVVYAVVSDNADNTVTTNTMEFYVDDDPPVLNIAEGYNKAWQTKARLEFNTYDLLSDIKYINVTDANGNLIEHRVDRVEETGEARISYCYFEATQKGTYYVIVSDNAGNIAKEQVVFDKVSDLTPECPEITITPGTPDGDNEWYTSIPSYQITGVAETSDGAPVTTKYQLWKEGGFDTTPGDIGGTEISDDFPGEGIYNIKTWSETASGNTCAHTHEKQVKIDTIAPEITFDTTRGSGSTILVHFEVTDSGSGVDAQRVLVLHGKTDLPAKMEETAYGYEGSFEISEIGNYSIQAADLAGNVAETISFTPMSMKIRPVTNITKESVTLGATVIKGTFDITNAALSYRKYADSEYKDVSDAFITKDTNGNLAVSSVLSGLETNTIYSYKVTATSAADEVLEYEGLFKTLSQENGITVIGTTRYANWAEGTITVALYDGNVCAMAQEVSAGDEFVFENVPDGNYNIVATDGVYSKSMRVLIKDNLILYPENYIELILSGKNTAVVLTTADTPHVTADNMDSIFNDDVLNYNSNDSALVLDGGTVEFKLYATLMPVSGVSASEIAAMYAVTDRDKIVGAYLDLSLYKISSNADGEVVERKRVTELASGANLSVTIPLGELAGKPGLEVVRIHDTGGSYIGASLIDQDTNPNTYTVTTNQFSTYAVLYSVDTRTTTETPKTTTTQAPPATTTENVVREGTTGPSTTGSIYNPVGGSSQTNPPSDDIDEDDIGDDDDDDEPIEIGKPDSARYSSIGSLRSAGSAKTGDAAPIAGMIMVVILAAGGLVVLMKKRK